MFVTNSMFCWVLGGFGSLAMSGYSPFSIKSVCGRTFTDKNDSLPGRSLRAIQITSHQGISNFGCTSLSWKMWVWINTYYIIPFLMG
jgi:hypothetical protein